MIIRGIPADEFERIVKEISTDKYAGNVVLKTYDPKQLPRAGWFINFTLRVKDSHGPGFRYGFSGRHTISACWHVHWDVLEALFEEFPDARFKSAFYSANGQDDWENKAAESAYRNVGSPMYPRYASEMCDCDTVAELLNAA